MTRPWEATAFAPATVGNVGVGFDIMGFPIEAAGDRVTVTRIATPGIVIVSGIGGRDFGVPLDIPLDPARNSATAGLLRLCKDLDLDFGFSVSIDKGIPLGSGMGGSAASAVAGIVAANALLESPLSRDKLFGYALGGEVVASGAAHPDNIAPCLFGGLIVVRSVDPIDVFRVPVPRQILCVLVHPAIRLDTVRSRAVLKPDVSLRDHVSQSKNLAGFLAGCFASDPALIGRSLHDVLIEPQRACLIPGFEKVKASALESGALACTISGSGPSVFALATTHDVAERARVAMESAFRSAGVERVDSWISGIRQEGAEVE